MTKKEIKNDEPKLITLDNLKTYTQEFLNKLFPLHSLLLTRVEPDEYGFPYIADLIDNSNWLPLDDNRMLRIMNTSTQPILGGGIPAF